MADNFICVASVVNKMELYEKGMLKGMLLSGKHFQNAENYTSGDICEMGRDGKRG